MSASFGATLNSLFRVNLASCLPSTRLHLAELTFLPILKILRTALAIAIGNHNPSNGYSIIVISPCPTPLQASPFRTYPFLLLRGPEHRYGLVSEIDFPMTVCHPVVSLPTRTKATYKGIVAPSWPFVVAVAVELANLSDASIGVPANIR